MLFSSAGRNRGVAVIMWCGLVATTARSEEVRDYPGLLGTRYLDGSAARSEKRDSYQYADADALSLNWPILSHFDLRIGYVRTVPSAIRLMAAPFPPLTDYYGQVGATMPAYNPPPNQTVTDANGNQVPADNSILIGNQPFYSQPGQPAVNVMTIQPRADTAVVSLAWYLRRDRWMPFARASLKRDWISYTQSFGGYSETYKVQHDGYILGVGVEVPIKRVVFTTEFTYNDLTKKRDVRMLDTRVYGADVDANLWLTTRLAAFIRFDVDYAKVDSAQNYSYGGGLRVRL